MIMGAELFIGDAIEDPSGLEPMGDRIPVEVELIPMEVELINSELATGPDASHWEHEFGQEDGSPTASVETQQPLRQPDTPPEPTPGLPPEPPPEPPPPDAGDIKWADVILLATVLIGFGLIYSKFEN